MVVEAWTISRHIVARRNVARAIVRVVHTAIFVWHAINVRWRCMARRPIVWVVRSCRHVPVVRMIGKKHADETNFTRQENNCVLRRPQRQKLQRQRCAVDFSKNVMPESPQQFARHFPFLDTRHIEWVVVRKFAIRFATLETIIYDAHETV